MPSLKDIRRRIGSVKSTQKITRAMKMVAAAKLRRAQDTMESFRSYADLTSSILAEVAAAAPADSHPLLKRRETEKALLLVITADRGLCGGFNANLNRAALLQIKEADPKPEISIIGRKAKSFFDRQDVEIQEFYADVYADPSFETAARIAREIAAKYESGEIDKIDIIYNKMISMMSQQPTVHPLLPVALPEKAEADEEEGGDKDDLEPVGFIFEPRQEELLDRLLPMYVEVEVYRAIIESIASEFAARMTAMEAATSNAQDMIDHLTLVYNRARQSAITSELMDIVGGAEALSE